MSQLPLVKSNDQRMDLLQTIWKSKLDPILAVTLLSGRQMTNIQLIVGTTKVGHLLGRKQQGYIQTNIDGVASYYRSTPFDDKTLSLTSDAACLVDLWVY